MKYSERYGKKTYFHGERAEYTGEVMHDYLGVFAQVRIVGGDLNGELRWKLVEKNVTGLK